MQDASKGYIVFRDSTNTGGEDPDNYDILFRSGYGAQSSDTTYTDYSKYPSYTNIYYKIVAMGEDFNSEPSEIDSGFLKYSGIEDLQFVSMSAMKVDTIELTYSLPSKLVSYGVDSVVFYRFDSVKNADTANMTQDSRLKAVTNDFAQSNKFLDTVDIKRGNLYFYLAEVYPKDKSGIASNLAFGCTKLEPLGEIVATKATLDRAIRLKWSKVVGTKDDEVTYYELSRALTNGSSEATILLPGDDTNFVDTASFDIAAGFTRRFESPIDLGREYVYKVRPVLMLDEDTAVGQPLEMRFTAAYTEVDTGFTKPEAPILNDVSKGLAGDSITVRYTTPTYADSFVLFRDSLDVAGEDWQKATNLPAGEVEQAWYDADVFPGIRYQYKIKVYKGIAVDSSGTDSGYVRLSAPDSLVVVDNNAYGDSVKLRIYTSQLTADIVDTIYIRRGDAFLGQFSDYDTVVAAGYTDGYFPYTDDGIGLQGMNYIYTAAFQNASSTSSYSSKFATGCRKLDSAALVSVSKGEFFDKIELKWTKSEDAQQYQILRDSVLGSDGQDLAYYDTLGLSAIGNEDTIWDDRTRYGAFRKVYYMVRALGVDADAPLSDVDSGYYKYSGVEDLQFVSLSKPKVDTIELSWHYTAEIWPELDTTLIFRFDSLKNIDSVREGNAYDVTGEMQGVPLRENNVSYDKSPSLEIGNLYFYRVMAKIKGGDLTTPSNLVYGYLNLPIVENVEATRGEKDTLRVSWSKVKSVAGDTVDNYLVSRYIGGAVDGEVYVSGGDTVYVDSVGDRFFDSETYKGRTYSYKVRAVVELREEIPYGVYEKTLISEYSEPDTGFIFPPAPEIDTVTKGDLEDTVQILYSTPEFIDSAVIYRQKAGDADWRRLAELGAGQERWTSYKDYNSDLIPGTKYYYKIKSYKFDLQDSSRTDSGYASLAMPTSFRVVYDSNRYAPGFADTSYIKLRWDTVRYASGYQIFASRSGDVSIDNYDTLALMSSSSDTTLNFVPSEFAASKDSISEYNFVIRAYRQGSPDSVFSAVSSAIDGAVRSLSAQNLQATNSTFQDKIRLTWNLPRYGNSDILGYLRLLHPADTIRINSCVIRHRLKAQSHPTRIPMGHLQRVNRLQISVRNDVVSFLRQSIVLNLKSIRVLPTSSQQTIDNFPAAIHCVDRHKNRSVIRPVFAINIHLPHIAVGGTHRNIHALFDPSIYLKRRGLLYPKRVVIAIHLPIVQRRHLRPTSISLALLRN